MADMTREEVIFYLNDLMKVAWALEDKEKIKVYEFAIADMERVKELEAENKHLKEGIANVKAEIEKYTVVDICKVSHVLQIIKKYLGGKK